MNYWIIKSEPEEYSFQDLVKEKKGVWSGVRNYQARNNLNNMKVGDKLLFYHSGKNAGIVAIAEVAKESYPDPTANDDKWTAVDVKPVEELNNKVTLKEIKNHDIMADSLLVRQSRLSVIPLNKEEYDFIINLSQ
ncbi:EVE domain-containing protein [Marinigracilibium pacificum]|uniref:EVE domain-containing protein n=1 Tax=Marinigracilibium pacificum TaxID=2729599 RepID=A0A848J2C8_9BACT|nr:EVE domain-containing protein [Marinigracilibium pacificum]NMM49478.1 EVE domain-containing protein [Marinigracilibium pacificum]